MGVPHSLPIYGLTNNVGYATGQLTTYYCWTSAKRGAAA